MTLDPRAALWASAYLQGEMPPLALNSGDSQTGVTPDAKRVQFQVTLGCVALPSHPNALVLQAGWGPVPWEAGARSLRPLRLLRHGELCAAWAPAHPGGTAGISVQSCPSNPTGLWARPRGRRP